ncbi:MAG: phytanoyl-CoA dioxygenase [Woeseiaceae bacterium]|nr:phytanoyl-CoA dioxygenase [Woeseiaceae bacterium]
MTSPILKQSQIDEFRRNGVLVIPGFYDRRSIIEPVQQGIYDIIGLLIEKYGLDIERPAFSPDDFDAGYQQLVAADRAYGGEVYDAVKQIPAFMHLVSANANETLFGELREESRPGLAAGGYGIRIDNPFEDTFKANWHQEYPAQLRSPDGIVYWTPLIPITPELGPVEICVGSHRDGPVPVLTSDPRNPGKRGAYSLTLQNEASLLRRYEHIAPLTNPGDLIVIDFMTLHASGDNRSERSRWSIQFRYFNFNNQTGIGHGWTGSYAAGVDFRGIHPELCADQEEAS